ncbi:glycosyltransferase [Pediococcus acidilactici]|uniref:glycosyltransferase n=1 Tax=Pediococcus acidilactici TaxID=1254 RepID=UPI00237F6A98|nr:glycosyltransferase [Pediococcus acidilactici]WDV25780.1 glycosyltransferase [Pediococcus acidilactici]WEE14845.1 glycosyltransferase [Pediococcus acidilactici]
MKILHYSLGIAPFRSGGMTQYSEDLIREQAKSNEVYLLYPGAYSLFKRARTKVTITRKKYQNFTLCEMKNPMPVSLGFGISDPKAFMSLRKTDELYKFLSDLQPNVIHVHTLMGLPREFFEYAKELGIHTVYTTHDYYGLCPKILDKGNLIINLRSHKCSEDCMLCPNGLSLKKLTFMQSYVYRWLKRLKFFKALRKKVKKNVTRKENEVDLIENERFAKEALKLRRYYLQMFKMIDTFHFNSSVAKSGYSKYGLSYGEIIPITVSEIVDNRRKFSKNTAKINIAFIGEYTSRKGFFLFKNVIESLPKDMQSKITVHFFGDIREDSLFKKANVINHGRFNHDNLEKVYGQVDVLVVPSIWKETFNLITLEALSYGIPVLVSQNVGAKDLYKNAEGNFVFNSREELRKLIIKLIVDKSFLAKLREIIYNLQIPFGEEDHARKILDLYKGGV